MTAPHDPQDPLPESTWTFRRWFTYGVTVASLAGVGWIIHKLADGQHLAGVAYGLIGLSALLATYYLIAPSAEHVVKIIRLASLIKRP
jgi:inner membrane protein involved in colicin E2 resistance